MTAATIAAAVRESAYGEVIPSCPHLVVDEAEDVSLVELSVLGRQLGGLRSVTLAGATDQTGSAVASSLNGGTTADQASWTNTGASAINVFVRVYRYSSTRTTYQLRVSY